MNDLQVTDLAFQGRGPYSFTIAPGRIAGMQGASGAGKTLLLRAIVDLDVHQGEVRLGDTYCTQIPAASWRKTVGLLPAESRWWFDTVGEHFQLPMEHFEENLRLLGFEPDVIQWQVSRLSTGEKQRLAIIRLLQNSPGALLLDEPTASLDAVNIERAEAVLVHYCRQQHAPLLWVSHDPSQLARVADVEYFLEDDGSLQLIRGEQYGG